MGKFNDLTGKRFGRYTVVERAPDHISASGRHRSQWKCVCDCGTEMLVMGENLTSGNSKSCGCLQKDAVSAANSTHGQAESKLYGVWCAMKHRCYNAQDPHYSLYGGRGITMCDEWRNDYAEFQRWAIEAGYQEGAARGQCTIDRIDNDKGYCPENCRWATSREQMNNVRYNHYLEYNGERHTIAEWSRITQIPYDKILNRINKLGHTPEKALTTN